MNKLRIEYVPIESIKEYENNAKIHTQEQIAQIKQSIKELIEAIEEPVFEYLSL